MEITGIWDLAAQGGVLGAVIVGFALAIWSMRTVLMPAINRIHTRLDALERVLGEARKEGADAHGKIVERLGVVEEAVRGLQRLVNPSKRQD